MGDNLSSNLRLLLNRQETEPRHEPVPAADADDDDRYVSSGHGRIGSRPQLSLLFRKADGSGKGFAYSLFCGVEFADPNEEFTVIFSGTKVIVSGRNLEHLLRRVCQHRQAEIAEAGQAAALQVPPGEAVVEAIAFEMT